MLIPKPTCNVSFDTADNESPKYFSPCLMLAIRYHLNSYCSLFLTYRTAFTAQSSLEMPITTFPALRKPKVCAVFEGQTPCFLYIEFNIVFANCLYLTSVDVLLHKYSMGNSKTVSL